MRLLTQIRPRRDGTVTLAHGGKTYAFKAQDDGALACDINDAELVANLLLSGNFFPANEADYDEALRLTRAAEVADGHTGADESPAADDDLDEDDEVVNGGLPVEAMTPPAPTVAPARGGRRKAA